jgi:hypothetical protein
VAIGLQPVEGHEPPGRDLELLAYATARADDDQDRYPADLRTELGLLTPVQQMLGRSRDPRLPPDAQVGDHHLRAFRRVQDRVVTGGRAVGARVCTVDDLHRAALAAAYFGLSEAATLLQDLSARADGLDPNEWTDWWLEPLASIDVQEVLIEAMAQHPADFAPTIR